MATLTLTIFCILLIICIATNHFILYALFAGLVLFSFYSRKQGYTWKSIGKMILQGIKKVRNILSDGTRYHNALFSAYNQTEIRSEVRTLLQLQLRFPFLNCRRLYSEQFGK